MCKFLSRNIAYFIQHNASVIYSAIAGYCYMGRLVRCDSTGFECGLNFTLTLLRFTGNVFSYIKLGYLHSIHTSLLYVTALLALSVL